MRSSRGIREKEKLLLEHRLELENKVSGYLGSTSGLVNNVIASPVTKAISPPILLSL